MQSGRAGGGKPNAADTAQLLEKRRKPGALSGGVQREAVADEGSLALVGAGQLAFGAGIPALASSERDGLQLPVPGLTRVTFLP